MHKNDFYTCENLKFGETYDSKIYNYKQPVCDWLNAQAADLEKITNAQCAMRNYLLSNPDCSSGLRYKNSI